MVKITRPIKQGSYLRHRLFDQLDQMRESPVIWISAPAGSGKTTLISSYIESRKLSCLWYQCDKDDSDPATFFYYMGLAAAKANSGKRKPLPLFTPEYQQGISTFTRNYFEQLYQRLRKPSLIVFDNYQDVAAASDFPGVLQTALTHLPCGINVAVISRHDPPDSFIRLQANSKMVVLRWEDIRLTEEEARSIIHARAKALHPEEVIQNLYQMSDGWAAGLVLMIAALKNQQNKSPLTRKHSYDEIIAYFGQEIFNDLDPKLQDFFLRTAYLPKMTAQMAMELTGDQSAAEILRTMNKNNYFISRHGQTESLYEYHPLYRDFLQSQAEQLLSTGQLHDLQVKAANLLEQNGQTEAAASLLRDIGDWQALAFLVLMHAQDMLKQGRFRPVQEWLDSLPVAILDGNPWLLYVKGICRLPYTPAESRSYFEKAFQLFKIQNDDKGALMAWSGAVVTFVYEFNDFKPLDGWIAWLDERIRQNISIPSSELEASVSTAMVNALTWRMPAHPDITEWLNRALSLQNSSMHIDERLRMCINNALCYIWIGKFDRCGELIDEMKKMIQSQTSSPLRQISLKNVEAMYYNTSTEFKGKGIQAVSEGLDIATKTGVHVVDTLLYAQGVCDLFNQGDLEKAREFISKMEKVVREESHSLSSLYVFLLAWHSILSGDLPRAVVFTEKSLLLIEEAGVPVLEVIIRLVLAYALHETGARGEAQTHLDVVKKNASAMRSDYFSYLAHLTDAYFKFAGQDCSSGLEALRTAMALGRQHNFTTMLYFWQPAVFSRLCAAAIEAGIEVEYAKHLVRKLCLVPEKPPVHIENWPWPVKIYTMGRFAILINDAPLPPQRKAKQTPLRLLKAIIALGGRDIACEKLVDLLWPDADGDTAHHALETTLLRLRKLFGYPEAIILTDGKLTLDNRYCWVDVWAFERLLGQADALKADESLKKKELIEKAVALYKGDFFNGERQDSWMISSTEHLKSQYFKSIWWLVNYLQQQGQWDTAAQYCEKFLKVDACREDIYRNLMICHKNLGRKSEALLVYQRCRKTLSCVLGIEPSRETRTVYNAIMSEKN